MTYRTEGRWLGAALAIGLATACTGAAPDAGTPDGGGRVPILIPVSGVARSHPLNVVAAGTGGSVDFTQMKVSVVDPVTVMADPDSLPLAGSTLDTGTANCPDGACAWSFPAVELRGLSLGLVTILEDTRTANPLWFKTGTGIADAAKLTALRKNPAPLADTRAYGVTRATEDMIRRFVNLAKPEENFGPGGLFERGFLLGMVVGKESENLPPIEGAKVQTSTTHLEIMYPNADYSAVATSTSSTGVFVAVPKGEGGTVSDWTAVPPDGETRKWHTRKAGTNPNTVFVFMFNADP